MSTPDSTVETTDLEADARAKQDKLTHSVGTTLASPVSKDKQPWWNRLLGRG